MYIVEKRRFPSLELTWIWAVKIMLTIGCLSTGSCHKHMMGRLIFEQMPPGIVIVSRCAMLPRFLTFVVLLLDIFSLLVLITGIYLERLLLALRYCTVYND